MSSNDLARPAPVAIVPARKAGAPSKLTPEVHAEIVTKVQVGRFAWVAAASAGIPPATYYRWMQRGQDEYAGHEALVVEREQLPSDEGLPELPPLTLYAQFWFDVTKARAFARGAAEVKVLQSNPLAWLTKGPGRDRPGEPGWTETSKVELSGSLGVAPVPTYKLANLSMEQLDVLDQILSAAAQPAALPVVVEMPPDAAGGEGGEGAP